MFYKEASAVNQITDLHSSCFNSLIVSTIIHSSYHLGGLLNMVVLVGG